MHYTECKYCGKVIELDAAAKIGGYSYCSREHIELQRARWKTEAAKRTMQTYEWSRNFLIGMGIVAALGILSACLWVR